MIFCFHSRDRKSISKADDFENIIEFDESENVSEFDEAGELKKRGQLLEVVIALTTALDYFEAGRKV